MVKKNLNKVGLKDEKVTNEEEELWKFLEQRCRMQSKEIVMERKLKQVIEKVLLSRIKVVGDNEHSYYGYPIQLVDELVHVIVEKIRKGGGDMV